MTLENSDVIDAIGTEEADETVVLSILDSWDWNDARKHLLALQEKLNAYFSFVESGQIFESYPDARGKLLRIDVVSRFPIPDAGLALLAKATAVAAEFNITVTHRLH